MTNTKSFAHGAVWVSIGTVINILIKLMVLVVLSRLLTPVDFGIVASIQIIISFSEIFWMMGVGPALVQKENINSLDISTGFYLNVFFGIILLSLFLIFYNELAIFLKIKNSYMILGISIIFFVKSLSGVSEALLQRNMNFNILSVIQIISMIIYAFIAFALAFLGFGAWSIILAIIIQNLFNSIFILIKNPINIFVKPSFNVGKQLLIYGTGFTISRIFNTIANEGDNLVVNKYLGASSLGNYSRAYQILMVPTLILGTIIDKVMFPLLSRYQNDHKSIRKMYIEMLSLILLITSPIIIYTLLNTKELVYVILGSQWSKIVIPLQFLILSLFFRIGYKICDTITYSLGKVYKRTWTQFVYALCVLIGAFFSKNYGIYGVALSTTIAIAINFLLMNHLVIKIINLKYIKFKKLIPNIILQIVFLISYYIISSFIKFESNLFSLLINFVVLVIIYILLFRIILFNKLDFDTQTIIKRFLKKLMFKEN